MNKIKCLPSWYGDEVELTEKESKYLKLVTRLFNVKTEAGTKIPYRPTKYQAEFHANSINIKKQHAKDILFIKARGVSFTTLSCMELILSAFQFKSQIFPIIAQRQDSAIQIVNLCKWLIRNANVPLENEVDIKEMEIRFLRTNSSIRAYPSGSASDAVRGLRLIRALIDEYAFQQRDKELLASVQDAMIGKLGQIIIGSTPCGRNNHFFELVQNPVGFRVFRLPAFDERKIDLHKSLFEQNLKPIAPWINLRNLETKRMRDLEIFKQEHMCDFLDDSLSFIPYNLIMSNVDKSLINYLHVIKEKLDFVFESQNPMYVGIDVARNNDLTAIVIFEKTYNPDEDKYVMVERYIETIKNMPLPKQQEWIDRLFFHFPQIVRCRVDMTGIGLGLFEYLKRKHGNKIEGVHFAEKVRTGQGRRKAPITERMSVNLKTLLQDNAISLIEDDLQIKHLNDVDYNFQAIRRQGMGHGDIFWACGLALLPERFRSAQTSSFETNIKPQNNKLPILSTEEVRESMPTKLSWEEHLKYLRRQRQKGSRRW